MGFVVGDHHHKNHMNFHIQKPHHHHLLHFPPVHHNQSKKELKDVPKGCLAILVGQGEEQERFVIPLVYFTHPLFMNLLKEAEEEFGFDQKGPLIIPCRVDDFRSVQGIIDKEHHHHHHHHHHHSHHVLCFRV